MEVVRLINGPEAFTPGRRVHPRPDRRARASGSPPASAPTASPAPAGWASSSPSGSSRGRRASTSGRWTRAASARALPQPRLHARAHDRGLRDLLRRQVPGPRAAGRPAAARLADVRAAAGARRRLRREVGLGARELVRAERGRRRRVAAAARLGREALVAGDRRRAPRLPRGGRALRRDVVRQDRGLRRRRRGLPRAPLREPGRPRRRRDHLHADAEPARRDRVRLHGHAARRGPLPDRHGHRLRPARPRLDRVARARRRRVAVEDVTSRYACLGLWGPKAREILQPLVVEPLDFPYMRARELAVGPVPCLALRVTYVGELGWELYCPMEYGLRLWDELWAAGREHGLVAGGYKAIDSLRLEKGYRVWGADITPEETPFEAGLGFAVKLDKDVPRPRRARAARASRSARLACLVLDDPRSVALGSEPVRVERRARRPRHERRLRLHRRALDRVRVRARPSSAAPGTPVEVEIFGDWVAGEVAAEPLYDPSGDRIRAFGGRRAPPRRAPRKSAPSSPSSGCQSTPTREALRGLLDRLQRAVLGARRLDQALAEPAEALVVVRLDRRALAEQRAESRALASPRPRGRRRRPACACASRRPRPRAGAGRGRRRAPR